MSSATNTPLCRLWPKQVNAPKSRRSRFHLSAFCFFVLPLSVLVTGCGGGSTNSGLGTGGGGGTGTGGGGSTSQPTAIQVQFTQSSGINSAAVPASVATQIGSGNWTAATLSNGTLTISIPAGTQNYAFAYVCPATTYTVYQNNRSYTIPYTLEFIRELTVQDSAGPINQSECVGTSTSNTPTTTSVTLSVDASAIPNAHQIEVLSSLGWGYLGANSGSVSMNLASGTSDFLVCAEDARQNVLAVRRLHSQTIPGSLNGGQPVVLASSDETTLEPVTYQNTPANSQTSLIADFETSSGLYVPAFDESTSYQFVNAYQGMPADVVESGDYYWMLSNASVPLNGNSSETSAVSSMITTPTTGPFTITFPPPLPTSDANNLSFAANTMPTFNVAYSGFSNPSLTYFGNGAGITWTQESSSNAPQAYFQIDIYTTASYMNGATTLPIPDLSSIPGFIAAPGSGVQLNWFEYASGQGWRECYGERACCGCCDHALDRGCFG